MSRNKNNVTAAAPGAAATAVLCSLLLLSGCYTKHEIYSKHDIHITLDIRQIETAVNAPSQSAGIAAGTRNLLTDGNRIMADLAPYIQGRKDRRKDVRNLLASGAVGENNQGFLEARPVEGSNAAQSRKAQDVVNAENRDRNAIYDRYAREQGLDMAGAVDLRRSWSATHRGSLQSGQWFQAPNQPEHFATFLKSDLGRAFPTQPPKGIWLQAPGSAQKASPTGKQVGKTI